MWRCVPYEYTPVERSGVDLNLLYKACQPCGEFVEQLLGVSRPRRDGASRQGLGCLVGTAHVGTEDLSMVVESCRRGHRPVVSELALQEQGLLDMPL